jgi:hypothetical protein
MSPKPPTPADLALHLALEQSRRDRGPQAPAPAKRARGVARFKVHAVLEQARPTDGTVTIDRGAGTFSVRPARRRRVYTLPLALVECYRRELVEHNASAPRYAARPYGPRAVPAPRGRRTSAR